jgi:hypothetical protein
VHTANFDARWRRVVRSEGRREERNHFPLPGIEPRLLCHAASTVEAIIPRLSVALTSRWQVSGKSSRPYRDTVLVELRKSMRELGSAGAAAEIRGHQQARAR